MGKIGTLAIGLLLGGLVAGGPGSAGIANAQALDDGSQTGAREAPVSSSAALAKRALVTFFKSRLDEPSAATAVTVVNNSNRSCRVRVDWFVQSEPDAGCAARACPWHRGWPATSARAKSRTA
jgi:hypothetical protein